MIDWLDLTRDVRFGVEQVSQHDLDTVLGELEGIVMPESSVECGYYTDGRCSSTITFIGDSYIPDAMLRPYVSIPEIGYKRELGLYVVTEMPSTRANGVWVHTATLESILTAMSFEESGKVWAVQANGSCKTAMRQMLERCGRKYRDEDAPTYIVRETRLMPSDQNWLSRLYDLANLCGIRLEMDGHGTVVLEKYVLPLHKSPCMRLDLSDPRGVLSELSLETNYASRPTKVIVRCKYSETVNGETREMEVVGYAEASGSYSAATRGYEVTHTIEASDMTPRTVTEATRRARESLNGKLAEIIDWEFETPYLPLWEGDVVEIVIPDGNYAGVRKCLVKSMEISFTGRIRLSLKETSSPDEED